MTEQSPEQNPEQSPEQAPGPAAEAAPAPEAAPEPPAAPAQPAYVPEHPAYSTSSYPGWAVPAQALPPAKPRRRTALLVAGALVVAAALGGGGYVLYGRGDGKADGKPSAGPSPAPTKAYGVTSGGSHYGDLGQMLLPVPSGMTPGPDDEEYGNDSVFDAGQARKVLESGQGDGRKPTAAERKQIDAAIDAMHVKGLAIRTYTSFDGDETFEIILTQVGNQLAAQRTAKELGQLNESADTPKGPSVKGYPHAVCIPFGPDADSGVGDWMEAMFCQATEGDLMVQLAVQAVHPMNKMLATTLMAQQLDRIKAPGETV